MENLWLAARARHVFLLCLLSVFMLTFGTVGYMVLEGFPFIDALYMTIITLTTVGFGEVRPLGPGGRLFTILLIFLGAGFVAYNLAYFTQLLLDGNLLDAYRRIKVQKQRERLKGHFIVCGYGQMGQIIVSELLKNGMPVIVIENDETLPTRLLEKGTLHIVGDATEEKNLMDAGVYNARGLVSVVSKDSDNVFIVLTARDLNKHLSIYTRAHSPGAEKRLFKAGADRVVSPYSAGAARIAHHIMRPTVVDFLDLALSGKGIELSMEELVIPVDAELVGRDLMHSGIRGDFNLIIVGIKRCDGRMVYNPSHLEVLNAGDTLIALGPQENLARFRTWLKEQGAGACSAPGGLGG